MPTCDLCGKFSKEPPEQLREQYKINGVECVCGYCKALISNKKDELIAKTTEDLKSFIFNRKYNKGIIKTRKFDFILNFLAYK